MLKRFLVVAVFLGTAILAVGAGGALGVVLGARAIVVSATLVKPVAALNVAPSGRVGSLPILVAMRQGHGG